MRLVMVHGRAQEGKNPDVLVKEWLDALAYGLARANQQLPPGTKVEFPFYGDELERLVKQTETPLSSDITAKGTDTDTEKELRGELLADFAHALGITDDDIAREFAGMPQEKGPQNWEWVQAILRAVDRVPGVNSGLIDAVTRDVYVYLTYPAVRAKIDALVKAKIDGEPCVVLAHSLGTVVTYNVLYNQPALPQSPRFVTVGSPLGIRGIKRYLDKPLRSPQCIGNWFNAYDDRDVVALVPLDAKNFDVEPAIQNMNHVKNFTDNRHGIAGYLADPIVASKIVEYL